MTDYRSTGSSLILSVFAGPRKCFELDLHRVFYVVFTYSLEF